MTWTLGLYHVVPGVGSKVRRARTVQPKGARAQSAQRQGRDVRAVPVTELSTHFAKLGGGF